MRVNVALANTSSSLPLPKVQLFYNGNENIVKSKTATDTVI